MSYPESFIVSQEGYAFIRVHKDCPNIKVIAAKASLGMGWSLKIPYEYTVPKQHPDAVEIVVARGVIKYFQIRDFPEFRHIAKGMENWII